MVLLSYKYLSIEIIKKRSRKGSLIGLTNKLSVNKKKLAKIKLSWYLDISTYVNIDKHFNIAKPHFEGVKLKKRDKSRKS